MTEKHIAAPVFEEDDFGKHTYCGVWLNDGSAVAPSQITEDMRLCETCKFYRYARMAQ